MAKDSGQFTIEFTTGELLWLSRALGKLRLSLPGDPFSRLPQAEVEAQIQQGGDSLTRRGLIRPTSSPAWEVDRFAAILLEWLAEAERFTLAEIIKRGCEPRQAGVYFLKGKGLLAWFEAETYCLQLFEQDDGLRRSFLDFLGIPNPSTQDPLPVLRLPQPAQLLPLAWRDPEAVTRLLKITGYTQSEAKSTLARLKSWEFIASLCTYNPSDNNLQPVSLQFLSGEGTHLWGSKVESKETELVEFEPIGNNSALKLF
jgi:hypothetical protein